MHAAFTLEFMDPLISTTSSFWVFLNRNLNSVFKAFELGANSITKAAFKLLSKIWDDL